jgi:RNA polymerase sigma factor (sigma-70 family)
MPAYLEERDLISACIKGEPSAWDKFCSRYDRLIGATISAFARRRGDWRYDEEEFKGYVYEKLLDDGNRRLQIWRGDSRFSTYLVMVTRNLCIDYVRKLQRAPVQVPDTRLEKIGLEPDIQKSVMAEAQDEEVEELRSAIESLPSKQVLIMKLRLRGFTLREIATQLKLPPGTVFSEDARARKKLKVILDERLPFADRGSKS